MGECLVFEVIAYFGFSYLIVSLLLLAMRRRCSAALRAARYRRLLYPMAVVVMLILPLLPYFRVEANTLLHVRELKPCVIAAVKRIDLDATIQDLKVMSFGGGSARVLAISKSGEGTFAADIVTLRRRGGRWVFEGDYSTVWSQTGSADGNTFPPYAQVSR